MALHGDPYRILGLARGASLDEVKRAYRRLAKEHHPDAAGAGALPRFLAIQAAYEQLAGDGPAPGARGQARGPATSSRRSSAADPDRADATRRAYGGRPRGRRRPTDDDGERPGAQHRARADDAAGDPGGPADPADAAGPEASGPRGKATLGSTSYDGADAGPFEPDWGGASWYGTTSGTYWTINPKEYADPRKHGPEYQARARRASAARPTPGASGSASADTTARDAETPIGATAEAEAAASAANRRGASGPSARHGAAPDPVHATSSWWDSTAGPSKGAADQPARSDTSGPAGEQPWMPPGPVPDPARAAADLARALIDPHAGGLRGRVMRAFIGWVPIALGIGWLLGELTGCGRFAATCDPTTDPLILVAQGGALVALLLLPVVASLAAGAALGLLAAAVAATLVLSATGSAADEDSRRASLGVVLLLAWVGGLVVAVAQRVRSASSGAGPVS